MKRNCELIIDDKPFEFEVQGNFTWGKNQTLFKKKDNVISKSNWYNKGYSVVKAFNDKDFERLRTSIGDIVKKALLINKIPFDKDKFKLEDYHNLANSNELHNKVIEITRNLENQDFDFDIDALAQRFGEILDCELTSWIEELGKSHVQLRISRPDSLDINPPHRDGYLSYWENIINIWIPIVGCNQYSSLPLIPGSHLIPENEILRTQSKGAIINGNRYYVPCILATKSGALKMLRPNPRQGEALIFTPYLIHGAAVNQNKNITRMSLELRFPKV